MKIITGLTDQPKQIQTITLADGSKAVWTLTYRELQLGWFWDLTWAGATVANGQRLVASPNILRSFINTIPFGISVMTQGNVEPLNLEDLSDGTAEVILLEGDDLSLVETAAFGAPAGQTQAIGTTPGGSPAIIPPTSWGPAGGDLGLTYPNPIVRALHESGGVQLPFGPIGDGQFLKRVGTGIVGSPGGTGDVVGPAGAPNGNLAFFDGTTGKLIKDGGNLFDSSLDITLDSAVASILQAARYNYPIAIYPGAGSQTLNLSNSNRILVPQTGALVLSFAGFANSFQGVIVIQNTTGGALGITWPACALSGDALPTSLAAGQIIAIPFEIIGSTLGTAVLYYRSPLSTGGLPTGGGKFSRLIKQSATNYDAAWLFGSIIDANDYLTLGMTIQDAFNTACTVNGLLLLPPGVISLPVGGLVVPSTFIGGVGIRGCGKNVSVLRQGNATTDGLSFIPSLANGCQPGNTFFHLSGFTVKGDNAALTGVGVRIDFGTAAITSQGEAGANTFNDIHVDGWSGAGNFQTSSFFFRNVWQSKANGLSGGGNSTSTGDFMQFWQCINFVLSDIQCQEYFRGIYVPAGAGPLGDSQGLNFSNFRATQCQRGIDARFTVNGGIFFTNWMIDNGDNPLPSGSYLSVYLENVSGGYLIGGQILQGAGGASGGQYKIEINGGTRVMIQNVEMRYTNSSVYVADIHLTGGVTECGIFGNSFDAATAILADVGTSGTKAINNCGSPSYVDNGANTLTS